MSWINISLVANDSFVTILLRFMSNQLLRESACDCIHEIVMKGMDPLAKTKLIESFMSVLQSAGVFTLDDVCCFRFLPFPYQIFTTTYVLSYLVISLNNLCYIDISYNILSGTSCFIVYVALTLNDHKHERCLLSA